MNTSKLLIIALFLVSGFSSQAITNTAIAVSGTNIILSWPSYGYESYLVQYRQTLDPSDSWSALTNAYPANSTNQTTFVVAANMPTGNLGGGTNAGGASINPTGTNTTSSVGTNTVQAGTGFFRVFHIPDWLVSFSGYTFDGPTFIPVDYSAPDAPTNYVDNTTVLINGQPTDDTTFIPYDIGGTTYWGMGIYFDRFPNGTNTIQLLTTVRQSDTLNDQTPYMVFSNAPQTIVISNFVTYTNWSDLMLSNTYTFNAQSTVTNVDWEIDIYDVYGDFVNSQTGHSDDGKISWTWDLTDYNGDSRKDDGDPFFYPSITIGDPTTGSMPPVAAQFPVEGAWLFAYMDKFYDDGTSNYIGCDYYYTNGIQALEGGPELWGTVTYDAPINYGRDYDQATRNASWDSLRNDLQSWNARNFYYSGHGAANAFGGDLNVLDSSNNIIASINLPGSKAYITSRWVHDNVAFNKSSGAIPFRFVFLDGCNTASGDWPQAWGVPKQSVSLDWYRSSTNNPSGARPNAFVGWDVTVGGQGWGTVDKYWSFRENWMATWSVQSYGGNPASLNDAFETARSVSGWVPSQVNAHLKKYGYTDMTFKQFNQAGDWP